MNKLSILSLATYGTMALVICNVMMSFSSNVKLDNMDNRVDKIEQEMLRLEGRIKVLEVQK